MSRQLPIATLLAKAFKVNHSLENRGLLPKGGIKPVSLSPSHLSKPSNQLIVADSGSEQRAVLSKAAKLVISMKIKAGLFDDQEMALEPPFMPPSTRPEDYSMVSIISLGLFFGC